MLFEFLERQMFPLKASDQTVTAARYMGIARSSDHCYTLYTLMAICQTTNYDTDHGPTTMSVRARTHTERAELIH